MPERCPLHHRLPSVCVLPSNNRVFDNAIIWRILHLIMWRRVKVCGTFSVEVAPSQQRFLRATRGADEETRLTFTVCRSGDEPVCQTQYLHTLFGVKSKMKWRTSVCEWRHIPNKTSWYIHRRFSSYPSNVTWKMEVVSSVIFKLLITQPCNDFPPMLRYMWMAVPFVHLYSTDDVVIPSFVRVWWRMETHSDRPPTPPRCNDKLPCLPTLTLYRLSSWVFGDPILIIPDNWIQQRSVNVCTGVAGVVTFDIQPHHWQECVVVPEWWGEESRWQKWTATSVIIKSGVFWPYARKLSSCDKHIPSSMSLMTNSVKSPYNTIWIGTESCVKGVSK